jgi:hypothetical protein
MLLVRSEGRKLFVCLLRSMLHHLPVPPTPSFTAFDLRLTIFTKQIPCNHTFTRQSAAHPGLLEPRQVTLDKLQPISPLFSIYADTQTNHVFSVQSRTPQGRGRFFKFPRKRRRVWHLARLGFCSGPMQVPALAQRFNLRYIKSLSVQVPRRILLIWMKPPNSLHFR